MNVVAADGTDDVEMDLRMRIVQQPRDSDLTMSIPDIRVVRG